MKHRALLLMILCICTLNASAQRTPFEKYEIPSGNLVEVLLDHIGKYPCHIITNGPDEYFGQTAPDGNIYGFGRFMRQDGTQIFGIFRNGKLLHGITLTQNAATVGNRQFYSSYNLSSGVLDFVFQAGQQHLYDTKMLTDYRFMNYTYNNGDRYIGETYQGKRHGLGLYYYANGSVWFGQYDSNIRKGFGCLFTTENDMTIGLWEGEDQRRDIYVRMNK